MPPQTFSDPVTARVAAFLDEIGIPVIPHDRLDNAFLPGIRVDRGRLLVDEQHLLCPGDILHEAGHLAVMLPADRAARVDNVGDNQGEEIVAILWSWAALTHIGLAPDVVFHGNGYKGASDFFIKTFGGGDYPGLPLLQWMGLTLDPKTAATRGLPPFPHMLRWLREDPAA